MQRNIKVAFVRTASNKLRLGGYNIQEIGLAKALLKLGISTDFYARFSNLTEPKLLLSNAECQIRIVPLKGIRLIREVMFYPSLLRRLRAGDYSIVLLEDESQFMLPYLFFNLSKYGIKTALWQGMYRGFEGLLARYLQYLFDFFFKKFIIKYARIKLAKTNFAKKYLLSKGYTNVSLLPVGLDYIPEEIDMGLEQTLKGFRHKKEKVLLYIGVIDSRRDVKFLVDVLKLLNDRRFGLIVVGAGPKKEALHDYVAQCDLLDSVILFEPVPNTKVHLFFRYSDVFLLPTYYEIYGMVVLEALRYGVPVISTKEAGPLTILEADVFGRCLDMDVVNWSNAIQDYSVRFTSKNDSKLRSELVQNKYNWDNIAVRFLELSCT